MSTAKDLTRLEDLTPDPHNANVGTLRGDQLLNKSMDEYGAGRSILADKHGVIIAGGKTFEAAVERGLPIRVVRTDGSTLVVVQRTDLDLDDKRARVLAYLDNRVSEVGLEWDRDQIEKDLARGVQFGGMFSQQELDDVLKSSEVLFSNHILRFDTKEQFEQWERLEAHITKTYAHLPGADFGDGVSVHRVDGWVTDQLKRLSDEL